ncbi:hypothetical protein V6N11_067244 [Hibiscus sabdariffa]|uniref:Uncharacterized protein n=1 Tax=Hibiscus sabdariffa TaxID=183260 RepID=A0ABR2SQ40_9ROSI
MMKSEEKQILPHKEELEIVNLGTEGERREIKIGTTISAGARQDLIKLLHEYRDIFAWSYQDMPGLDQSIAVHRLPIKAEYRPVQQKLRRMRPDVSLQQMRVIAAFFFYFCRRFSAPLKTEAALRKAPPKMPGKTAPGEIAAFFYKNATIVHDLLRRF